MSGEPSWPTVNDGSRGAPPLWPMCGRISSPTTQLSTPPDRKSPYSTSLIMRLTHAFSSAARTSAAVMAGSGVKPASNCHAGE